MKTILKLICLVLIAGCALTSCNSKESQLNGAIKAINKQFPQEIAEGYTLQGFFPDDKNNIDITITMNEQKVKSIPNDSSYRGLQSDIVHTFSSIAAQDKDFLALFGLINENQKTMSLTFVQQPSGKKHRLDISREDIKRIATPNAVKPKSDVSQLDEYLEGQKRFLPLTQGPITVVSLVREGNRVVWNYEVADSIMENLRLNANDLKQNLLRSYMDKDNISMVRLVLGANCSMLHHYVGKEKGEVVDLVISQRDLRNVQRTANSTKIEEK